MKSPQMTWIDYVQAGLGRRLSHLGEVLGVDWLIYNRLHFGHFHVHALENAPPVIKSLNREFPEAESYVDVGAGTGVFSAELMRQGRKAVALEHSAFGRKVARRQGVPCHEFDLSKTLSTDLLNSHFDIAISFEVAEHLRPDMGNQLVECLSKFAPLVIFSAAHPGQGGTGHINEQPREYWISRFKALGFQHDEVSTLRLMMSFKEERVPGFWFHKNILVFRRAEGVRKQ